jgi:endo-1,4-beta-mannosidase
VSTRPMSTVQRSGAPQVWLGVNFWSRAGGPRMWVNFDEGIVRKELSVLAQHGLNVTRSFFYLPDFMPAPDILDEECCEHYAQFLDLSAEAGLGTIPTFIVGHMSGENWDVDWRAGRDLYADGWMLAQQCWFAEQMARRFGGHEAVAGWLASNEMPLYGGATTPEYARSWGRLLRQAVRAAGATQPFSLGDGGWGIETSTRDNGFRLRELTEVVDFFGPHCYPLESDVTRQLLTAPFVCELSHLGRPVVLEEFGVSSAYASDENAAVSYRHALHGSLLAGATGWIGWNNTDFDLVDQDPYRHHAFELTFGVTRIDGTPKPALEEMAAFRAVLEVVDVARCHRPQTGNALLVSSYFEVEHPMVPAADRHCMRDILLQAYVATRGADLGVSLAREVDGIPDDGLILVPSTKQLLGPSWLELEQRAREGSTVYVSYFAGPAGVHRGMWHPDLNTFFGVRHRLRYGMVDPVDDDVVTWTMQADIGDLAAGDQLSFRVGGSEHGRAFLPLEPVDAYVLAIDGHGRPAVVERAVGAGRIVLSAFPVEYMAASSPRVNPEATARWYRALAARAGTLPAVRTGRTDVHVDRLVRDDGEAFVWFASHVDEPVTVDPILPDAAQLTELSSDTAVAAIPLAPRAVEVYRLRQAAANPA